MIRRQKSSAVPPPRPFAHCLASRAVASVQSRAPLCCRTEPLTLARWASCFALVRTAADAPLASPLPSLRGSAVDSSRPPGFSSSLCLASPPLLLMSRPPPAHVFRDPTLDADEDGTTWMQPLARSWEEIQEGAGPEGGLSLAGGALAAQRARKKALESASLASGGGGGSGATPSVIEKGVIRYLFLILDFSWASSTNDMKPSRRAVVLECVEEFIREFFDQNPLSHLGIIGVAQGIATRISELSGSPSAQIAALKHYVDGVSGSTGGDFGLQNSLDLAREKLMQIPPYGSREVVVLLSALSTVDPGDLLESIAACAAAHVTASVISVSAEMYVANLLATSTGGSCSVALNREHFQRLLLAHIPPIPASAKSAAGAARARAARKWIHMGFPSQTYESFPSLCTCHQELKYGGFHCPKCLAKVCELPTECNTCALTLVASPHLARSYHHLFPVRRFKVWGAAEEGEKEQGAAAAAAAAETSAAAAVFDFERVIVPAAEAAPDVSCRSCVRVLPVSSALRLQCPKCRCLFCLDCDEYIHTVLHNCPGCLSEEVQDSGTKEENAAATASAAAASKMEDSN